MKTLIVDLALSLFFLLFSIGCEDANGPHDPEHLGRTLIVPDFAPNIQAAIDLSEPYDEILLKPGTYRGYRNTDLDLKPHPLTIRSETGPESCVLDGDGTHRFLDWNNSIDSVGVTIEGITFRNGSADLGGAILYNGTGDLTFRDCAFEQNHANQGGALYGASSSRQDYTTIFLENCQFTSNTAIEGGSIFMTKRCEISACQFVSNVATQSGGAIFEDGGTRISITQFIGNVATPESGGLGGAIFGDVTAEETIFEDNHAAEGGAYYFAGYDSRIKNCRFYENTASHRGGAIISNGWLFLTTCEIANNAAIGDSTSAGGGICVIRTNQRTWIENCKVENNRASKGGGVYCAPGSFGSQWTEWIRNEATLDGGAVAAEQSSGIELHDCRILENSAGRSGGGIYTIQSNATRINRCVVANNSTLNSGGGGGVYFAFSGEGYGDTPSVLNSILRDNISAGFGGGLFVQANASYVIWCINNTFARNQAAGRGGNIYCGTEGLRIKNTILWDGSPDNFNLHPSDSVSVDVTYSDFQDFWPGLGNISADPMFSDDELHLDENSPCIDAGNSIWPWWPWSTIDIDNDDRIVGSEVDIGADEFSSH